MDNQAALRLWEPKHTSSSRDSLWPPILQASQSAPELWRRSENRLIRTADAFQVLGPTTVLGPWTRDLRTPPRAICHHLASDYIAWGPNGAPQSPKSIQGHEQLPILAGLTKTAEVRNRRLNQGLDKLNQVMPGSPVKKTRKTMQHRQTRRSFLAYGGEPILGDVEVLENQEFERELAQTQNLCTALMKDHETFAPGQTKHRGTMGNIAASFKTSMIAAKSGRSAGGMDAQDMEDDETQAFQERMEAFKYVRKIEPAVPPLDRNKPFIPREIDSGIVKANMSPEKLRIYRPSTQHNLRIVKREASEKRFLETRERFEGILESHEDYFARDLERKFKVCNKRLSQFELIEMSKLQEKSSAFKVWFMLIAHVEFIETVKENLKFHKMPTSELMMITQANDRQSRRLSGKQAGSLVLRALQMNELLNNQAHWQKYSLIAAVFQSRIRLRMRQRMARYAYNSMDHWKKGGRFIMSLKRFYQKMRRIQDWWRIQQVKIHRSKDKLCRTWIKLEKRVLHQEISSQPEEKGYVPKTRRGSQGQNLGPMVKTNAGVLSIEEKVSLALMENEVRRNFVTLELRARRYLHLPKMYVWEDEMKKYWGEVAMWRETKNAAALIHNKEEALRIAGMMPWPPACPSYYPHDEKEVMDMVTRARKDPADVTLIPTKGNMQKLHQQKRGRADEGNEDLEHNINDEELKHWGIDLDAMPGLGKGAFRPYKAAQDGTTARRQSLLGTTGTAKRRSVY